MPNRELDPNHVYSLLSLCRRAGRVGAVVVGDDGNLFIHDPMRRIQLCCGRGDTLDKALPEWREQATQRSYHGDADMLFGKWPSLTRRGAPSVVRSCSIPAKIDVR